MRFFRILLLCLIAGISCAKAQMGYQISLLNTATGEPRANETVTVSVSLSNNANEVFYTDTKSATTNDFGVLSLSIGNADTFKDVDLSKMPFFIEAKANGVMIGKNQILTVPVAEVAKRVAPIDKDLILGTWKEDNPYGENESCTNTFYSDGTIKQILTTSYGSQETHIYDGVYEIEGNSVYLYMNGGYGISRGLVFREYRYYNGWLLSRNDYNCFKL